MGEKTSRSSSYFSFSPKRHGQRGRLLTATLALLSLLLCHAASASGRKELSSIEVDRIPIWPIYAAVAVAVIIAISRAVRQFNARGKRAKVFPKVEFRRRLFAPYSGGNCAAIAFGSKRDDA